MNRGKVFFQLGDDVSTDLIYPGRFMATVLPTETPQHVFADHPGFRAALAGGGAPAGGVIFAGNNFGCGSSREQAVSCLKGHELTIVAKGIARIFLQNAINLGLRVVLCPTLEAKEGDELVFRPDEVANLSTGRSFPVVALPKARQAIIDAGGLVPYTRQLLLEREAVRAG